MTRRYVIHEMSPVLGTVLVIFFFLPMIFWGVWFNFWRVDLRCEHTGDTVNCVVAEHTLFTTTERSFVVHEPLGAELQSRISAGSNRRGSSSSVIYSVVLNGRVPVSMTPPNFNSLATSRQREVVASLDAFMRDPSAAPLALELRSNLFLRFMMGVIGLLGLVLLWFAGASTLLEIDGREQLRVVRRMWKLPRSTVELPLAEVADVEWSGPPSRFVKLELRRHLSGGHVLLAVLQRGRGELERPKVRAFLGLTR